MSQFINGQWLAGQGNTLDSVNPATNHAIWQGKTATAAQVDQALKAARAAAFSWAQLGFAKRQVIVVFELLIGISHRAFNIQLRLG